MLKLIKARLFYTVFGRTGMKASSFDATVILSVTAQKQQNIFCASLTCSMMHHTFLLLYKEITLLLEGKYEGTKFLKKCDTTHKHKITWCSTGDVTRLFPVPHRKVKHPCLPLSPSLMKHIYIFRHGRTNLIYLLRDLATIKLIIHKGHIITQLSH